MGPLMINMAFMACLYICEKREMSRLWRTDTRTDTRTVESRAVFSLIWIRKMILWPGVSLFLDSWVVEIYHRVATQNRSIWELQNLRITEFENRRISFEILILTFHLSYSYMYFKSTNQILSLNNFCGMINHFWKTAKNMTYVKCGSH